MALSRLTLWMVLYLSADFANPLMPGAVSFLEGSVEAVHLERGRIADAPDLAELGIDAPTRVDPIGAELGVERGGRPPTSPLRVRPRLVTIRRALLARLDPSSPSDDH